MKTNIKIPINKLVDYCLANSTRRTKILEDILSPKNYLLDTGYNDIERASIPFFSSKGVDLTRLDSLDNAFRLRVARTEHEEARLLNAHDAIFLIQNAAMPFSQLHQISEPTGISSSFEIGGITVNVNPTNLIIQRKKASAENLCGVIKPYLSKTIPLITAKGSERAAFHGTLLTMFCERNLSHIGTPEPKLCFSVDVFAKTVSTAPTKFVARRKIIEASVLEITERWDAISSRLKERLGSGKKSRP